jgi:replicative DNA helicase
MSSGYDLEILGAICGQQELIDEYNLNQKYFTKGKYRKMFNLINKIHNTGATVDIMSISDLVGDHNLNVSDFSDLNNLYCHNAKYYIEHQQEILRLEYLRKLGLKINDYVRDKPAAEILDEIEKEITGLSLAGESNFVQISDCIYPALNKIEEYYNSGGAINGVPSGYKKLDRVTNGFQDGDLIIIGARASIGKTAIALNMATHAAKEDFPVGFFSCEMSKELLTQRIIASEARLNMSSIKSGKMKATDFANITTAAGVINESKIFIDDSPNIPFTKLKSQARVMKRKGIRIIFVDYLTLIGMKGSMSKVEKIGAISKGLKGLARELNVPIAVLSQLNREAEGKRPTAANLRWSGEIEEDADLIMLLHRKRGEAQTELIIDKHRNGSCETIDLHFAKECMRFENVEYREE